MISQKARTIANSFGFSPISTPAVSNADICLAKKARKGKDDSKHEKCFPLADKVTFLRTVAEQFGELRADPKFIFSDSLNKNGKTLDKWFLHAFGVNDSLSDALTIKTTATLLEEQGFNNILVKINSIGNRDSLARFSRELNNFSRMIVNELDSEGRNLIKKGVHSLLSSEKYKSVLDKLPESVAFLNEEDRKHFKSVLEHLETIGLNFEIDKKVLGSNHYSSNTVFEIEDMESKQLLAIGSRHNSLAKRIGFKKEVPGIGSMILIKPKSEEAKSKQKSPSCFFVSFGPLARMKSLTVLDSLRRYNIPAAQSLAHEKISAQLACAERTHCPYIIIMGHQEAVENKVIIRHSITRSQTVVSIESLPTTLKIYLKRKA